MKMLYRSLKTGDFYILKGLIESHGIGITVRNEDLQSLVGRVGFSGSCLELWINNDKDYQRAEEILQNHLKSEPAIEADSWKCKKCGEMIEVQFTACWKCGNNK